MGIDISTLNSEFIEKNLGNKEQSYMNILSSFAQIPLIDLEKINKSNIRGNNLSEKIDNILTDKSPQNYYDLFMSINFPGDKKELLKKVNSLSQGYSSFNDIIKGLVKGGTLSVPDIKVGLFVDNPDLKYFLLYLSNNGFKINEFLKGESLTKSDFNSSNFDNLFDKNFIKLLNSLSEFILFSSDLNNLKDEIFNNIFGINVINVSNKKFEISKLNNIKLINESFKNSGINQVKSKELLRNIFVDLKINKKDLSITDLTQEQIDELSNIDIKELSSLLDSLSLFSNSSSLSYENRIKIIDFFISLNAQNLQNQMYSQKMGITQKKEFKGLTHGSASVVTLGISSYDLIKPLNAAENEKFEKGQNYRSFINELKAYDIVYSAYRLNQPDMKIDPSNYGLFRENAQRLLDGNNQKYWEALSKNDPDSYIKMRNILDIINGSETKEKYDINIRKLRRYERFLNLHSQWLSMEKPELLVKEKEKFIDKRKSIAKEILTNNVTIEDLPALLYSSSFFSIFRNTLESLGVEPWSITPTRIGKFLGRDENIQFLDSENDFLPFMEKFMKEYVGGTMNLFTSGNKKNLLNSGMTINYVYAIADQKLGGILTYDEFVNMSISSIFPEFVKTIKGEIDISKGMPIFSDRYFLVYGKKSSPKELIVLRDRFLNFLTFLASDSKKIPDPTIISEMTNASYIFGIDYNIYLSKSKDPKDMELYQKMIARDKKPFEFRMTDANIEKIKNESLNEKFLDNNKEINQLWNSYPLSLRQQMQKNMGLTDCSGKMNDASREYLMKRMVINGLKLGKINEATILSAKMKNPEIAGRLKDFEVDGYDVAKERIWNIGTELFIIAITELAGAALDLTGIGAVAGTALGASGVARLARLGIWMKDGFEGGSLLVRGASGAFRYGVVENTAYSLMHGEGPSLETGAMFMAGGAAGGLGARLGTRSTKALEGVNTAAKGMQLKPMIYSQLAGLSVVELTRVASGDFSLEHLGQDAVFMVMLAFTGKMTGKLDPKIKQAYQDVAQNILERKKITSLDMSPRFTGNRRGNKQELFSSMTAREIDGKGFKILDAPKGGLDRIVLMENGKPIELSKGARVIGQRGEMFIVEDGNYTYFTNGKDGPGHKIEKIEKSIFEDINNSNDIIRETAQKNLEAKVGKLEASFGKDFKEFNIDGRIRAKYDDAVSYLQKNPEIKKQIQTEIGKVENMTEKDFEAMSKETKEKLAEAAKKAGFLATGAKFTFDVFKKTMPVILFPVKAVVWGMKVSSIAALGAVGVAGGVIGTVLGVDYIKHGEITTFDWIEKNWKPLAISGATAAGVNVLSNSELAKKIPLLGGVFKILDNHPKLTFLATALTTYFNVK